MPNSPANSGILKIPQLFLQSYYIMMAQTDQGITSKCISILSKFVTYTFQTDPARFSPALALCNQRQTAVLFCKLCEKKMSKSLHTYECNLCGNHFCIAHFLDHSLLFGYCEKKNLSLNCKSSRIELGYEMKGDGTAQ